PALEGPSLNEELPMLVDNLSEMVSTPTTSRNDGGSSSGPATDISGRSATIKLHRMTHFPVEEDFLRHCHVARV
ncbi:hypothetical protein U1Q18_023058, partial [Sarracenia purpurea var. burkii]